MVNENVQIDAEEAEELVVMHAVVVDLVEEMVAEEATDSEVDTKTAISEATILKTVSLENVYANRVGT